MHMHLIRRAAPGLVLSCALLSSPAVAAEPGPFIGVDLGYSAPTNKNYRAHVDHGGTANPFAGYMFNDYLGAQGQLHFTFQLPDDRGLGFRREKQTTTLLGATVGPRLALPLGDYLELYGTGQGGVFQGVSGRLHDTALGFSVGGGLDVNVTPQLAIGIFGRWNRAYMSPRPEFLAGLSDAAQGPADARWVTTGLGIKYAFNGPPTAPPPAPAAVPPPPPLAQQPLPPVERRKLVPRGVNFDFDKAVIRPDAVPVLRAVVESLKSQGDVSVVAHSHTDSVGSESYNQQLSVRRAEAVRKFLADNGIPPHRITIEAYGESRPVASNDTAEGRAENRRVELHLH